MRREYLPPSSVQSGTSRSLPAGCRGSSVSEFLGADAKGIAARVVGMVSYPGTNILMLKLDGSYSCTIESSVKVEQRVGF